MHRHLLTLLLLLVSAIYSTISIATDYYGNDISLVTAVSVCQHSEYSPDCQALLKHMDEISERNRQQTEEACQRNDQEACAAMLGGLVQVVANQQSSQYASHLGASCSQGDTRICQRIYDRYYAEGRELIDKYYTTAFPKGESELKFTLRGFGYTNQQLDQMSSTELVSTWNQKSQAMVQASGGGGTGLVQPFKGAFFTSSGKGWIRGFGHSVGQGIGKGVVNGFTVIKNKAGQAIGAVKNIRFFKPRSGAKGLIGNGVTKSGGGFGKLFQQRAQTLREASIEFNRVGRDLQVPGGLAGAIRHTKQTGNLVGGSDHLQKGRSAVRFYNRQIKQISNSYSIPEAGRQRLIDIATRSRDKIQNALDGY